jgi:hypothetical protein
MNLRKRTRPIVASKGKGENIMKKFFLPTMPLGILMFMCWLMLDGCNSDEHEAVVVDVTDPVTDMPTLCKERILTVMVGDTQTIDLVGNSGAEVNVEKENNHINVSVSGNQITVSGVSVGISKIAINSGGLGQVVKVRVDDPKALQIDDAGLLITYTDQFTWIWDDSGSGASDDGSFWAPVPPVGYKCLGSLGRSGWSDPSNSAAMACVKAINGSDALADPIDYQLAYEDHGTGGNHDVSVWKPIAPEGYAALGMVARTGYGNKPDLTDITCVKKTLLTPGVAGAWFWDDSSSGGSQNFGGWYVMTPANPIEDMKALLPTGGTFVSRHDSNYQSPPATHDCMWVFNVILPVATDIYDVWNKPELTGPEAPLPMDPHIIQEIGLPLGLSKDPASGTLGTHWLVENSPVYRLRREFLYNWNLGWDNVGGSESQSVNWTSSTSYETSNTTSFTTTHGIEVGMELGVAGKIFSGSVSFKYSYQWSSTTSTTVTRSYTTSITRNITVPAGKYVGLWQLNHVFKYYRHAEGGDWQLIPDNIMSVPTEEVKTGEYP